MNDTESSRIFFSAKPKINQTTTIKSTSVYSTEQKHYTKMMTPTARTTTHMTNIHAVPVNEEHVTNYAESLTSIIKLLSTIQFWIVVIAAIIITIVAIKIVNRCVKIYKVHNERIIQRHSRISLQN